jgi:hypothetical protein
MRLRLAMSLILLLAGIAVTAAFAQTSRTLTIRLRGFGASLGSSAACPDGRTQISIIGVRRYALDCVLAARKLTKPGLDPWRIIETVRVTTQFPGGTIRTRETQTFTFTSSSRSTALFRGQIVGGTGRFHRATGSVSGGGPGRNQHAVWTVAFRLND